MRQQPPRLIHTAVVAAALWSSSAAAQVEICQPVAQRAGEPGVMVRPRTTLAPDWTPVGLCDR